MGEPSDNASQAEKGLAVTAQAPSDADQARTSGAASRHRISFSRLKKYGSVAHMKKARDVKRSRLKVQLRRLLCYHAYS